MKFRFALIAACASTFAFAPVHQAQAAACVTSYGNGIYQVCQGTCLRYIDGVEFLAPCLKAVEEVQAAVKKAKKH